MSEISTRGYRNPDRLVSTDWVADHLSDPNILIVESNEDPLLYSSGHIPGAAEVDWTRDLNHPVRRDYLDQPEFEALIQRLGITSETTIIFYGDRNNWWATYALWVFGLFGFHNTKIMDGGRIKWEKEARPLTREKTTIPPSSTTVGQRDDAAERIFRDEVLKHVQSKGKLIDVRSPQEFTGERMHMPDYPNEGALRGGHIPGAASVPWAKAINPEDGTFLNLEQLQELYTSGAKIEESDDVVVYCRIGERSSHTWFVLKYLLGYENVRNYDGSWTEWGNLVGVPIEK